VLSTTKKIEGPTDNNLMLKRNHFEIGCFARLEFSFGIKTDELEGTFLRK
jgi:hypothetical protein